jgi:small GTP-binding protein
MAGLREVQKKIILLGDGAVGKTSLIRRFVVDAFDDKYIITIGTKVTAKAIQVDLKEESFHLSLQIWDILGQKGYTKLHLSSFRGTDGVFMVTDITRKKTLFSLGTYWIPKVQKLIGNVPFSILANKSDLMENAEFSLDELKRFALKYNVPYYITSAKSGDNVNKAFYALGKQMLGVKKISGPSKSKSKILHPRLLFEGDVSEITKLIDKIIDDFCREYESYGDAMPVIKRQFEIAGLDLNNPSIIALKRAVHRLAKIEKEQYKNMSVEANLIKRLNWIKESEINT